MINKELGVIVKSHAAVGRVYNWKVFPLSILPVEHYSLLPIEIKFICYKCELKGQFYWQTRPDYQMYYYCPRCKEVWTVEMN